MQEANALLMQRLAQQEQKNNQPMQQMTQTTPASVPEPATIQQVQTQEAIVEATEEEEEATEETRAEVIIMKKSGDESNNQLYWHRVTPKMLLSIGITGEITTDKIQDYINDKCGFIVEKKIKKIAPKPKAIKPEAAQVQTQTAQDTPIVVNGGVIVGGKFYPNG